MKKELSGIDMKLGITENTEIEIYVLCPEMNGVYYLFEIQEHCILLDGDLICNYEGDSLMRLDGNIGEIIREISYTLGLVLWG